MSATAKKVVLDIAGMSCSGCAQNLTQELLSAEGVEQAQVSFEKATAEIFYDPTILSEDKLKEIVSEAGYTAKTKNSDLNVHNENFKIPDDETVTIFRVPLVCRAATHIGCGSRSKPLLVELEKEAVIDEAWLNRGGTQLAVVWKKPSTSEQREESIKKFLNSYPDLDLNRVSGEIADTARKGFQTRDGWYRGSDVDRLSEEEAGVIAARFVSRFRKDVSVSEEFATQLQKETERIIAEALVGASNVTDISAEKVSSQLLSLEIMKPLPSNAHDAWKSAIQSWL